MPTPEYTTHSVYRIVCFQTGKVYIGQTNDPKVRQSNHQSDLKRHQHANQYLQAAYNKYGRDAFYFEVLEREISKENINIREMYWIDHFDSFRNGFNLTAGGYSSNEIQQKPSVWNGVSYVSLAECARANGVDHVAMIIRFKKGYTCDNDMPGKGSRKSKSVSFDGIEYPSINAAARAYGIGHTAMRDRLEKGYANSSDVPNDNFPQACVWEGVEYNSITECAISNGISVSTMQYRIAQGYNSSSDMKHKPRR